MYSNNSANPGITVCIPSIPPRMHMLDRAIQSVHNQSSSAWKIGIDIQVAVDNEKVGAWDTRQRALDNVHTSWVAFLDDDDEFMSDHLEKLYQFALDTGSDYVYSYYIVKNHAGQETDSDPLHHFGEVFNPENPIQTTIVTLVKSDLAKDVGFKSPPEQELIHGMRLGEDFVFTLGCVSAGAKITHLPEKTWYWWHHGANTSGLPQNW